ncbi:hypothetical protein KWW89_18590 [Clostridioides difficile]|nr:hypothetical protein [Clostridioides difficile]MCB4305142.1 hypothetical protein [Clostridioides difficile]MCW0885918.1 hypothetical protein [Clostridioides difficile]HEL7585450.1 hypothetical protein [Clostridioides difficile]
MGKVEYIVFYYNHEMFKLCKKSFSALTDAKVFRNEIMKEYESVDIIKRTVFEELIL